MVSPKPDPEVLEFEKNCVFFRNFGEKPKGEGAFFWKFWDTSPTHFNFFEGRCWEGWNKFRKRKPGNFCG
jgi:hypothetical protein